MAMLTDRQKNILAGVDLMDPTNNDHWTETGAVKLSAVQELAQDDTITAAELHDLAPGYTRQQAEASAEASLDEMPDTEAPPVLDLKAAMTMGTAQDVSAAEPPAVPKAPKVVAVDKDAVRKKLILTALSYLDHAEPKHWNEDGTPNAIIVAQFYGASISDREIKAVAPSLHRMPLSPGERGVNLSLVDEDAPQDEAGRTIIDLSRVTKEDVDMLEACKAEIEDAMHQEEAIRDAAVQRLMQLSREYDQVVDALRPLTSSSFSSALKEYQASQHLQAERRARDHKQMLAAAGLRPEAPPATPLDAMLRMPRQNSRRLPMGSMVPMPAR